MDVARLNLSHAPRRPPRTTSTSARSPIRPAAPSASSSTCRAEDRLGEFERRGRPRARRHVHDHDQGERGAARQRVPRLDDVFRAGARREAGRPVLIDDGNIRLEVLSTRRARQDARHRGRPRARPQGNQPARRHVSAPALSEKDRADLEFGLSLRVDLVALSFVRRPRTCSRCASSCRARRGAPSS